VLPGQDYRKPQGAESSGGLVTVGRRSKTFRVP